MSQTIRITSLALLGAIGLGLIAPAAAQAGSKGRRNTALLLGAVTAYGIVKKKPAIAGIAGAGAIYSYLQSRKAAKRERDRNRYAYRRRGYRSAYYRPYRDRGNYRSYRSSRYDDDYGSRRRHCDDSRSRRGHDDDDDD